MEKLMIIDGHSIMNRAFYALPLLTNKNGKYTNAIYGFLNILFKFIEEEKPEYIGISFDLPKPTFRHLKYSEYKGNRKKSPPELKSQIQDMKVIIQSMGIPIYQKEGFEADDVLATIATKAVNYGLSAVIVTGDRDLLQIATKKIKIKVPTTKNGKSETENYFEKDVIAKYGVTPTQFIDVKALMGDTSDNVPGVPSIGEKTAIKIILQHETVENAIQNINTISSKKIKESLEQYQEQAILSKYLVTIDKDVDIEFLPIKTTNESIFNKSFFEQCEIYELKNILNKFSIDTRDEEILPFNLIETISDAKLYVNSIDKNFNTAYKIIYDDNKFIGISFTTSTDVGTFIKVNDDIKEDELLNICKPFFGNKYPKITLDAKTDFVYLYKNGVILENVIFDVMVAGYILDATKNKYEYNNIAQSFLDKFYIDKDELLGRLKSKLFLLDIDPNEWLKYCCNNSYTCFMAMPIMHKLIEKNNQSTLFYDIEMPLIFVLANMEILGIRISYDELVEYRALLQAELDTLTSEIYWLVGEEFNINSPKQLGEILFDKLELTGGKKLATSWSTSADILEKIKNNHEVIPKILTYRTYAKLKSTYADGLLNVFDKKTGRIHSKFNQTITATGRISSTEPNLQNIPIRLELGHKIRKIFKPNDDYVFIDADYSQIELRVLAHLSGDDNLISAFNDDQDIHKKTASQILNKPLNEITPSERTMAKAINFGLIYGKQAFTLSQDLKITIKQAEQYINDYFNKYPYIKGFLDKIVSDAKVNGYVKTLFERRRYIPEINSPKFMTRNMAERTAMNMPIQGTSADIIKIAMVKVHTRINKENLKSKLILQVHDELLIETHKDEVEIIKNILKDEMENAVDFSVNLLIDIHEGANWYDAK